MHPGPDGVKGNIRRHRSHDAIWRRFCHGQEHRRHRNPMELHPGCSPTLKAAELLRCRAACHSSKSTATSPTKQRLVGGIGVFFPGPDGYATFEQNFVPTNSLGERTKAADRCKTASMLPWSWKPSIRPPWSLSIRRPSPASNLSPGYVLKPVRIDLAGITLEADRPSSKGRQWTPRARQDLWRRQSDGGRTCQ